MSLWTIHALINGEDRVVFADLPSHELADRIAQRCVELGWLVDGYRVERE